MINILKNIKKNFMITSKQKEFNKTVANAFEETTKLISAINSKIDILTKKVSSIEDDHKIENLLSSHELKWLNNKKG